MALSKYGMMMGLLLFNMFLFPMIATSIAMPGVVNPISDLFPGFGQTPSQTGAGTGGGPSDTVQPAQQNVQSCTIGGAIGVGIGAIGFIAGPVGIGTTILGGLAGCAIASTFFPSQGSAVFSAVANSAGPVGDFMKALGVALAWVGPILKFFQDMVAYEFALLVNAPEIGVFLFPFQAITAVMLIFVAAEYIRGTGIGA